jgi:hypothetical protein
MLSLIFTGWLSTDNWTEPNYDLTVNSKSKSHWDLLSVSQYDQIFISVWQLRSCFCGAPSLTRGRVCRLQLLLVLASAVSLGSESLGTWDHILLSQFRDFSFRRLLRLAKLRWRYSTSTPHGLDSQILLASRYVGSGLTTAQKTHPLPSNEYMRTT